MRRIIRCTYFKNSPVPLVSGIDVPRDSDGITRDVDFVDCSFHPCTDGVFDNCAINGTSIPDGPGCLYDYVINR